MITAPRFDASDELPTAVQDVEIVIPVYNEEAELTASVLRLRQYLDQRFPFPAVVTIADNASTDGTWALASSLARHVPGVRAIRLPEKGRGRALRAAWMASDAAVVAYMDVDLATDLDALLPLVAPLLSGHSDLAIGSRLARGSQVVRGPKRELISRCYNLIVRATLHNGFSDAQCGFKALRGDVARELVPEVHDDAWFFDTELLVLAEWSGLRIHEVPVDWVDDPDSRVDLRRTALDDLKGIARLMGRRARGQAPVHAETESRRRSRDAELARFASVGLLSTLAYLVLFVLLRPALGPFGANAVSLVVCTVANMAAHRRFTFSDRTVSWRTGAAGAAATFGVSLVLTSVALALAQVAAPSSEAFELAALVLATGVAAVVRFALLRAWVYRAHLRQRADQLRPTATGEVG
jgi:putative flippase GtrA